jgi:hypothetical protein
MKASSSTIPTMPPPLPVPPASTLTPRTQAAHGRGRQIGQAIRRHAELILGVLGALGITLAQAADGVAAVIKWGRGAGLWPALAVLAIGVVAAGTRQMLAVVTGLFDRLDQLASRWEHQYHGLRNEVAALRTVVDTGPHAVVLDGTDKNWPPPS